MTAATTAAAPPPRGNECDSAGPPPAATLCLPESYEQRSVNISSDARHPEGMYWQPWRVEAAGRYQLHAYRWGARLIRARGLRSALDVGCGVGEKLQRWIAPVCSDIAGVDQPSAIALARERAADAALRPINLEAPNLSLERRFDLILCCDVLEHLLDPRPALAFIHAHAHAGSLVLFSTPDRRRRRGRSCARSDKPEHVREWARWEFLRFVQSQGFAPLKSRLFPQDEAPLIRRAPGEIGFRLRLRATSPLACHAVLCTCVAAGGPTSQ